MFIGVYNELLRHELDVTRIKLGVVRVSTGEKTVNAIINSRFGYSAPSGTSKGRYEAKTLPPAKAIKNFNKIRKNFLGRFSQQEFDWLLKKNMDRVGAGVTTALSLAFFSSRPIIEQRFPNLAGKVFGGGMHAMASKINGTPAFQEFLSIPKKPKTIQQAASTNYRVWQTVGKKLKRMGKRACPDYESGWTGNIDIEKILDMLSEFNNIHIGIDVAASCFYKNGKYNYNGKRLSRDAHIEYLVGLCKKYKIRYLEDPVHEQDFSGFNKFRKKLKKTIIVGDDLTVTNPKRVREAIRRRAITGLIIKPNQVGTLADSVYAMKLARKNKIKLVLSHRSGTTKSAVLARLALYADYAKFGIAGIRQYKINELIRIWNKSKHPRMAQG